MLPSHRDADYYGIRDVDIFDPKAYIRVRATLPADPKRPTVDDILAGMCERIMSAYEKHKGPTDVTDDTHRKSAHYASAKTQAHIERFILEDPTALTCEIAARSGYSKSTVLVVKKRLRNEGKI